MSERDPLQYRPCVGVMLVNAAGQAFVGKRIDNKEGDWWQMPQGGVDPGEDLDKAMLRELGEEIGVRKKHVAVVARLPRTCTTTCRLSCRASFGAGGTRGSGRAGTLRGSSARMATSTSRPTSIPSSASGSGSIPSCCPS